ncbi:MAG: 4-hydroxy-tetrahydrodipicolinate synthase [Lachnospiraceae bacterium]|nr:4-hydroxy-tetrahydrodipicolinate synthase [Lachnospiraceae bacterium]
MAIFTGAGVAIVTPMNADGSVNFDKLGETIEYQIANKTDAIIICGTTGESSTLTHEEHLACIKYAVDKVAKRIPVVAGTGSNCTETAIYLSTEAEKYGVDGLLLVTPYYNKATQNGLIEHFTSVANSVKVPIILYNVPSRTGCNILPETAIKIAKKASNVVAIKEASGNISQVAKLANLIRENNLEFDIYSGNDDQIVPVLSLGGKGVISVLSNIAPEKTHNIVAKYLEGDVKESLKLQLEALNVIDALFCEVNPIPVKAALNMMGFNVGPLRKPLTEMEDAHKETLKAAMTAYGIDVK